MIVNKNGSRSKIVLRKGESIDGYINIHIEEARKKSSKSSFGLVKIWYFMVVVWKITFFLSCVIISLFLVVAFFSTVQYFRWSDDTTTLRSSCYFGCHEILWRHLCLGCANKQLILLWFRICINISCVIWLKRWILIFWEKSFVPFYLTKIEEWYFVQNFELWCGKNGIKESCNHWDN